MLLDAISASEAVAVGRDSVAPPPHRGPAAGRVSQRAFTAAVVVRRCEGQEVVKERDDDPRREDKKSKPYLKSFFGKCVVSLYDSMQ